MKNLLIIFIPFCLALFYAGSCRPAEAADTTFDVGSYYWATVGSIITIDISVENSRQLCGCNLKLYYDEDIVRAVSVEKGNLLYSGGNTLNADLGRAGEGIISIYWRNEYSDPIPSDGKLFRISFRVLDEGRTTLYIRDLVPFEKYGGGSNPYTISGTISTSASGSTSLEIDTNAYLPGANREIRYSTSLIAKGGRTPHTWSRTGGGLPPGLTLSSSGIISGTPTSKGNYSATIRVTDGDNRQTSRTFYLTVYDVGETPLAITGDSTLNRGRKGSSYTTTLAATGGYAPYSWSRTDGRLPPGLTLGSRGVISGTPTSTGTYTFTARVADDHNARQEKQFQITISDTDAGYISLGEDLFRTLHVRRNTMTMDLSPEDMPYTMFVDSNVNWINLAVTPCWTSDRLRINGNTAYSGIMQTVPLNKGNNQITIGISSTGSNYFDYSLVVYRLP